MQEAAKAPPADGLAATTEPMEGATTPASPDEDITDTREDVVVGLVYRCGEGITTHSIGQAQREWYIRNRNVRNGVRRIRESHFAGLT